MIFENEKCSAIIHCEFNNDIFVIVLNIFYILYFITYITCITIMLLFKCNYDLGRGKNTPHTFSTFSSTMYNHVLEMKRKLCNVDSAFCQSRCQQRTEEWRRVLLTRRLHFLLSWNSDVWYLSKQIYLCSC